MDSLINEPGFYPETITAQQYFAEPCPAPALTSGIIKTITYGTMAEAAYQHPALPGGDEAAVAEAQKRFGDVAHQLALGRGRGYAVLDYDDWRTKEARAARDEAHAQGLTPIKRAEFQAAQGAALVMEGSIARALLAAGATHYQMAQTEVVYAWTEETRWGPVWCRAMADVLYASNNMAVILDPKFSKVLNLDAWEGHAVKMGWDLQDAFYRRGVAALLPKLGGRIRFLNTVVHPDRPHIARTFEANQATKTSADELVDSAIQQWGKAIHTGQWPAYGDQITTWSARGFTLAQRMAAVAAEGDDNNA